MRSSKYTNLVSRLVDQYTERLRYSTSPECEDLLAQIPGDAVEARKELVSLLNTARLAATALKQPSRFLA